ncbi:MAG TPA: TIR domain-containing protein [Thermoanaerobaculia bacterium]|nr:TIR domain-containing protein [Thermoanaerobaculia bacterium]
MTADPLKVFLSYSRKDSDFAERLLGRLTQAGFETYLDKHEILPGEPWQDRIGKLIEIADTVVFLLSPDSVSSTVCDWEVNETERLGKRLLPVILRDVHPDQVPGRLKRLNYTFMRDAQEEEEGFGRLVAALQTDIDWIREHTRLGELALDWERGKRGTELLLRGSVLSSAELWLTAHPRGAPEPTGLHHLFIQESRKAEQARARRERRRNRIITAGSLIAVGIVSALGWLFFQASQEALRSQSLFLSDAADQALQAGDPLTAHLIALEGVPDRKSSKLVQRIRPREHRAVVVLDRAWRNLSARSWSERKIFVSEWEIDTVAFSPDGRQALLGTSDGPSHLVEVSTGKPLATLTGHQGAIRAASFSPDGTLVLTGSDDGTARLWKAATGNPVAVLSGHTDDVRAVAFSPDGKWALTGSWDGSARLWEASTGKAVVKFGGHASDVTSVAFSPDGRLVLTGSYDNTARLWETGNGKLVAKLAGHEGFVRAVEFSPDGKLMLTGSDDGTARLWAVSTGRAVRVLAGHKDSLNEAVFSPDGQTILTASDDATARLWDTKTGEAVATLIGHEHWIGVAAFSPDGRLAVTGSRDETARLWEVPTGELVAVLAGHQSDIWGVAFSPDSQLVLTGSWDSTARLWEASTQSKSITRTNETLVSTFGSSADGKLVATSYTENTVRILEMSMGRQVATLSGHGSSVDAVAFSPDGRLILTGSSDRTARLWEISTAKLLQKFSGHKKEVKAVAFSPDGRLALTGSTDRTARLWETATGKPLQTFSGHEDDVNAAAFSPDGRLALTGSSDRTARLWEVSTGRPLATLGGHSGSVWAGTFSPDGRLVLTGSKDSTARLWETSTGNPVMVLTGWEPVSGLSEEEPAVDEGGHGGDVLAVAFSSDGRLILTGSLDSTARIWEAETGKPLSVLEGHEAGIKTVTFSSGGRLALTGSMDGTARLWPVFFRTQDLVDLVQSTTIRCLAPEQREQFHLSRQAPRWCYEKKLWPYHDKRPASLSWDERLFAMWDSVAGSALDQGE